MVMLLADLRFAKVDSVRLPRDVELHTVPLNLYRGIFPPRHDRPDQEFFDVRAWRTAKVVLLKYSKGFMSSNPPAVYEALCAARWTLVLFCRPAPGA